MVASSSVDFSSLPLEPKLLRALQKCDLHTTTPVQSESIPRALEGRDMVVRARTGSGKTLAYVLPALHKIMGLPEQQQRPGWQAIVMVPTRELCKQVKEEADRVVEKCGGHIKVTALTGEGSEAAQRNALLTIGQLVVSTPGRIAQALRQGQLQPAMLKPLPKGNRPGLSTVVLDEADLMLSMPGYESDLREIIPKLPSSCQRILMSATTSPEVEALMQLALSNPLSLDLTKSGADPSSKPEEQAEDGAASTSASIDHFSFTCARQDKMLAVLAMLKLNLVRKKVLLFTNSVEPAFRLRLFLEAFGIRAALLSPDLPLNTRHHILQTFNKGLFDYLIAADTQVAGLGSHAPPSRPASDSKPAADQGGKERKRKREGAEDDAEYGVSRGVDFKGVATVINVDCPAETSKYVHRVGRTGRAGHSGTALTLLTAEDKQMHAQLQSLLAGQMAVPAASEDALEPGHLPDAASAGGAEESEIQQGLRDFHALKPSCLEALRYRAEDVGRSLTKTVIQEARAKELRAELLNSKRLQAHFEAHPGDLQLLQHDRPLAKRAAAPHLKHMPAYLRAAAGPAGKLSAAAARSISGKSKGQGKRRADPLKEGYARLARMDQDDQQHGPLTDAEKSAAKIKPKKKTGASKFQPKRNVRKGARRR